jgi:tetratricopeptide (TPR) repeat protein
MKMLNNLTSKRIALLIGLLVALIAAGNSIAVAQRRTGNGSGSGSGTGSGSSNRFSQQQQSDATTVFRSARDLITDGEWAKAQEKFSEYVSNFPNEKNNDAALYWLAYTQNKLAKYDECRSTIDRLLQKYPNTSWKDDARILMAQVPGASTLAYRDLVSTVRAQTAPTINEPLIYTPAATLAPMAIAPGAAVAQGQAVTPALFGYDADIASGDDDDPCEFKIVVLQALFQTDLQRGIMAATDWLKPGSTQTVRCKSAALTLLGRNGGKAVTPVILGVARNEPDLKLRARAIAALGATNDDSVIDALRDFAMSSQENDVVEASLYALSRHTGDRAITALSEFATNNTRSIGQRKVAIASIAARPGEPAVDALFRIYDGDQNIEIRKATISAFANRKSERAGTRLFDIARSSDNVELRKAAISAISRRGGDKTIEFLLNLYDTEKNEELKDQIINSLGYGSGMLRGAMVVAANKGYPTVVSNGNSRMSDQRVMRKMIEIARDQKAPMERRKRAIGWLSRSNDPEVLKFLEELLK